MGQLKKLEKQLDSSEVEKQHLSTNMKDIQSRLDSTLKDAALQGTRYMDQQVQVFVPSLAALDVFTDPDLSVDLAFP